MIDVSASSVHIGDVRAVLAELPEQCVQTAITSPPYWGLRDYGVDGQIGIEATPRAFIDVLVDVFRGVRRALRPDGTLWVNIGDSYAGGGKGVQGGSRSSSKHGRARTDCFHAAALERGAAGRAWRRAPEGWMRGELIGIPWMLAFALRADGWRLRAEVIWSKPNPMPESTKTRPTRSHEHLFLFALGDRYYYDGDAIREPLAPKTASTYGSERRDRDGSALNKASNFARDLPVRRAKLDKHGNPMGANRRSVWTIATQPYHGDHFAVFPPSLVEPCILAGSRPGDLVLDPFVGSGTTAAVAERLQRRWIGIDLSPTSVELVAERVGPQRSLPGGAK